MHVVELVNRNDYSSFSRQSLRVEAVVQGMLRIYVGPKGDPARLSWNGQSSETIVTAALRLRLRKIAHTSSGGAMPQSNWIFA